MKKIKSYKLFLHDYWNDFFIFCKADNLGRLPRQDKMVEDIKDMYEKFILKYKKKKKITGEDIMKDYPSLK